ncbi:FG-GAP-like repeat-containing protein [Chitinophaga ginsengisoli]|uniref:VCBS repeat protein n=1 Tax=Chitinophaga ginsengisoli TaxID=363837 RepID=A0A2P8G562_9BACT|nr:FG-GAP-like repeat-containing protein [Chitinophaga ginsengisoli]PSL29104.1 VCBS repeat protein [Chitinophaga ginsengisoli]
MKKHYFSGFLFLTALTVQANTATYRSFDPINGLHATYTGNELNITSGDAGQQLAFKLIIKKVGGYKPVAQPLMSMHENIVAFDHDHHFKVEYLNDEWGIRQKFVIQEAPAAGKLTVQLQAEKDWDAQYSSATSITFRNKGQQLNYGSLKVSDANGQSLPAHFTVHQNNVEISVDARHAAYPLAILTIGGGSTLLGASTLMQSDQVGARMGTAAAGAGDINGDGYADVIVGAPYYSHGESHEGAVFVYYGSAPYGINPNYYTLLEKNVAEGHFGEYLAGGGDVNGDGYDDVVVGAPYNSGTFNNDTGKVYVYYGSSTGLGTTPEIIRSSRQGDHFGISVAIAPDIDGDGNDDILIGANNGEGYVTVVYGSGWGLENPFTTEIAISGTTGFGTKVSDAGNIKGAGSRAVMVASNEGVYIYYSDFAGVETTPSQTILRPVNAGSFGCAITGGGDVNGDGFDDIVIGAKDYADVEHNRLQAGAFYLFTGSNTGLVTTPKLVVVGSMDSTLFASQLSLAGDLNKDGYDDLVVGLPKGELIRNENDQPDEGGSSIYLGHPYGGLNFWPGGGQRSAKANSLMGTSVAGAGDVNGDGYPDLLVGAPGYSNLQLNEGICAIFLGHSYVPARMAAPGTKK